MSKRKVQVSKQQRVKCPRCKKVLHVKRFAAHQCLPESDE